MKKKLHITVKVFHVDNDGNEREVSQLHGMGVISLAFTILSEVKKAKKETHVHRARIEVHLKMK